MDQTTNRIEMSINAKSPIFFLGVIKHGFTLVMNKYCFNDNQNILAEVFGVLVCRLLSIEVPISNQQQNQQQNSNQQQRYSGSNSDNITSSVECAELASNENENSTARNKTRPPAAEDNIAVLLPDMNEITLETSVHNPTGLRRSSFSKNIPAPTGLSPKRVQFKTPLITVRVVESDESSSGCSNSDCTECSDSDDEGAIRVSDITDEQDLLSQSMALDAQVKFWHDYHIQTKFKSIC